MSGQGSTANVIAALASFFLPGLGQLIQGRIGKAIFFVIAMAAVWFLALISFGVLAFLGIVTHIWAAIDAALWKPKYSY